MKNKIFIIILVFILALGASTMAASSATAEEPVPLSPGPEKPAPLPLLKNLKAKIVISSPTQWRPTYSRVVSDIKQLKSQYPGLIAYEWIGKSAAGKDIPAVTLGRGEKKVLIVSAIHAIEHVTALQVMRSIDTYAYAYAKNKKIDGKNVRKILDEVTFHFIPLPNPDGVAIVLGNANEKQRSMGIKAVGSSFYQRTRASAWKGNANAVNLNRNFPVLWHDQARAYKKPTSPHYPGKFGASEPETNVLMAYCRAHEFAFMLTNHTYGQVLYWEDPLTGTVPGASRLMNKIKSVTGYYPDPTIPVLNGGRFEKWFRYVFNRPGIVIEMFPSRYGVANSYRNFENKLWKRSKSLYLQIYDQVSVGPNYKLYFDPAGGKTKTVRKNIRTQRAVGKLPCPVRSGYAFSGWYTAKSGGTLYLAKTVFDGKTSVQLYAHWKKAS